MGWVPVHENESVPVFKNIVYGLGLLYKCDKKFVLNFVVEHIVFVVFTQYLQGILFLKVLLGVIQGNYDFRYYVKILLCFFAAGVLYEMVSVFTDYISLVSQKVVLKNLNNMIFEKAYNVDIGCYENPEFYDKYKRATEILSNGYFFALAYAVATMLANILSFLLVSATVAAIDARYLIFLAPILLVALLSVKKSKVVYKRDFSMTTNNRIKAYAQRTMFLKDYSKDMRSSNIFSVIINQFDNAVKDNVKILKKYGPKLFFYTMTNSMLSELVPMLGTYSFAAYQFVNDSSLNISNFSVVVAAVYPIKNALNGLTACFAEISAVALYFQNLKDFFSYETTVKDGTLECPSLESIEFKNVSFKYPSASENSLENINLKINKNETTAIVGVNGAGKTTFVKLLLRFYDVTQGEILYNGVNIKEYSLESLRSRIAAVFQDYKTFAVSVNENVVCHPCDENDKLVASQAMKQSGVYEKILSLEKAGETVLTREFDENGAGLSGGENQKLAVARLFARDFDLAILDEPSSALDPIAEYQMYENLIKGTKNKTVIYISHRLSSAALSDKVIVLGNKSVIEQGTHQELLALDGEYAAMFKLQASSYKGGENDG